MENMKKPEKMDTMDKFKLLIHYGQRFAEKVGDRYTAACAARAAFFIMLSVVPIITLILAAATYLPFTQQDVMDLLMSFIPGEFGVYVEDIISDVYRGAGSTVISVSIIATIWSSSKGVVALIDGFNSMYRVQQESGIIKSRARAVFYTVAFIVILTVILSVYVTVSHYYGRYLRGVFELGSVVERLLWFVRYVFGWLLFYAFILMLYVVLPEGFGLPADREEHMNFGKRVKSQAPGAAFCSVAWLVISRLVVLYMQHFSNFSVMYGSLAGIVILMLWLYFCMYSLFIGAVINYLLSKGYLTRVKKMLQ
ncbi:MAG: YihY/virulence factor BrkB family protein [Lachnospiraceae bacterium]|nr:YihY/virulence factor BrkB family protein [Lachnospiraceae bacterium]